MIQNFKYLIVAISALTTTSLAYASTCNTSKNYSFYLKASTGLSCSMPANVTAPYPPWNEAIEGYDASLGSCPIVGLNMGCEFSNLVDFEVSISNRNTFEYRKFQTPATGGDSYTRQFDLSVTPILFSVTFLGSGTPSLYFDIGDDKLYPIIGLGVGISYLQITNFRTTGLPSTGDSFPYKSFTSENQYTACKNFTYSLLLGAEYKHQDRWAISMGYRLLDAGSFKGPQYLRASGGSAVDIAGNTWKMRFIANELFVEFKIFI